MFKVITYTIIKKRLCRETSLISKGELIILYREGGRYKTAMKDGSFKYWSKEFTSLEKAEADFNSRVETRILSEGIYYNQVFEN